MVASTDYAASYTTSTGASPTGQVNPLLGQRVHRAMKRIRGEILNHCSTINAFCAVYYTSALDPPIRVSTPVYASPWAIKGRRPLEKGQASRQRPVPSLGRGQIHSYARAIQLTVDVGYYAPAARTTLNPRVFLCSCSLGRPAESLSASPSTHPLGLDGCTTPPGCGSPQTKTRLNKLFVEASSYYPYILLVCFRSD